MDVAPKDSEEEKLYLENLNKIGKGDKDEFSSGDSIDDGSLEDN